MSDAHRRITRDPDLLHLAGDGDGDALALIAIATLRLGEDDGARSLFEQCADLPHPTGLHGLAALDEPVDPDGSWVLMTRALEEGCVAALTRIARVARLRGEHAFAHDLLVSAARLGDADAMYDLAHAATDAGDDAASRRWYGLAVDRESGAEWPVERGVRYCLT